MEWDDSLWTYEYLGKLHQMEFTAMLVAQLYYFIPGPDPRTLAVLSRACIGAVYMA